MLILDNRGCAIGSLIDWPMPIIILCTWNAGGRVAKSSTVCDSHMMGRKIFSCGLIILSARLIDGSHGLFVISLYYITSMMIYEMKSK